MRNLPEGFNIRSEAVKTKSQWLEDRQIEIIQFEVYKEKKWRNEQSLNPDLWDPHVNICIIRVPEGGERKGQKEYWMASSPLVATNE